MLKEVACHDKLIISELKKWDYSFQWCLYTIQCTLDFVSLFDYVEDADIS